MVAWRLDCMHAEWVSMDQLSPCGVEALTREGVGVMCWLYVRQWVSRVEVGVERPRCSSVAVTVLSASTPNACVKSSVAMYCLVVACAVICLPIHAVVGWWYCAAAHVRHHAEATLSGRSLLVQVGQIHSDRNYFAVAARFLCWEAGAVWHKVPTSCSIFAVLLPLLCGNSLCSSPQNEHYHASDSLFCRHTNQLRKVSSPVLRLKE